MAYSQERFAQGSVIEYAGAPGELVVSRDGIIYYLSTGDDLFENDILRSKEESTSTIVYNGCVFELPASEDVSLDEEFCALVGVKKSPSMATLASQGEVTGASATNIASETNAPLIVGGVILSAGGLAAVSGSGGGTGLPGAAITSGNPAANNSGNASSP